MMRLIPAIQYVGEAKSEAEASEMLGFLAIQSDYLAGRVLPSIGRVPWRVQAFFEHVESDWLPDGCRHVLVPDRMLAI